MKAMSLTKEHEEARNRSKRIKSVCQRLSRNLDAVHGTVQELHDICVETVTTKLNAANFGDSNWLRTFQESLEQTEICLENFIAKIKEAEPPVLGFDECDPESAGRLQRDTPPESALRLTDLATMAASLNEHYQSAMKWIHDLCAAGMVFLREMVNNEQAKQQMLSYRNSELVGYFQPVQESRSFLQALPALVPVALSGTPVPKPRQSRSSASVPHKR